MSDIQSIAGLPINAAHGLESLITSDESHAQMHLGRSFYADYNVADAAPVADNANFDIWISVPAALEPHLFWKFYSEGLAQAYIYEDPTVTDEGTLLTPINRNRNSASVATLIVRHTPTVTDVGTVLFGGNWAGGATAAIGAEIATSRGLELKSGGTYLLRQTARANNLHMGIMLHWNE